MHNENLSTINPYLTFTGNCEEAMTFYKDALGAELELLNFEGSPMEVPEEYKNKIMHATLKFEGIILMASDTMPGADGPTAPVNQGNNIAISIAAKNLEDGEKFFNNLSDGGIIKMPFEETFWGAKFGMFTDKFGINWMVNCELKK